MKSRDTSYTKTLLATFNAIKEVSGEEEAMFVVASKIAQDQASLTRMDIRDHCNGTRLVTYSYFFPGTH